MQGEVFKEKEFIIRTKNFHAMGQLRLKTCCLLLIWKTARQREKLNILPRDKMGRRMGRDVTRLYYLSHPDRSKTKKGVLKQEKDVLTEKNVLKQDKDILKQFN